MSKKVETESPPKVGYRTCLLLAFFLLLVTTVVSLNLHWRGRYDLDWVFVSTISSSDAPRAERTYRYSPPLRCSQNPSELPDNFVKSIELRLGEMQDKCHQMGG